MLKEISIFISLASISVAAAQELAPAPPPGGKPSVLLQNRGNKNLAIDIIDDNGNTCGIIYLHAGQIRDITSRTSCGTYFYWNDSVENKKFPIAQGHVYEIYWNIARWDIRAVTNERYEVK
jgi:hypothetical protein